MHELSLVASIVDAVTESVANYPGSKVTEVRLRLGALADVVEDPLQFCWDLTVADTPLATAKLTITKVPVLVHCDHCAQDLELESLQSFRCPRCHEPVTNILQGREMEIESIEIDDGKDSEQA
ncbi:hydrogenase maturation nickel metallochaperone HypA [Telmatobacter bradus]|uniref:hydrogenase maturation nickel metallochaperone HypA n=1 Tax=Telmatobacter bradus TaxID=474953 RepID=UPI003B43003F